MTRKRVTILFVLLAGAVAVLFIALNRNKCAFPLDTAQIYSIDFKIYPQDVPNFTLLDQERIQEIAGQINALKLEKTSRLPDPMSDQYYFLIVLGEELDFSITLDEHVLNVGGQDTYSADCSKLCALLEQTYYDHKSGALQH